MKEKTTHVVNNINELKISKQENVNKKNDIVDIEEVIIDTTMLFGKCRIKAKNIKVYKDKILTEDNLYTILDENETFYFDRLHNTNKGNIYVSWGGFDNERIYAPYKFIANNNSPVIRISE